MHRHALPACTLHVYSGAPPCKESARTGAAAAAIARIGRGLPRRPPPIPGQPRCSLAPESPAGAPPTPPLLRRAVQVRDALSLAPPPDRVPSRAHTHAHYCTADRTEDRVARRRPRRRYRRAAELRVRPRRRPSAAGRVRNRRGAVGPGSLPRAAFSSPRCPCANRPRSPLSR